jgi:rhodanese-related sulfurtransferase
MRSLIKKILILGLLPLLFLTGCKEDPVTTDVDEFSTLTQYVVQNQLDMNDLLVGWVTSAGGLNVDVNDYSVPDYYVIDLRSADAFNAGHIKDAHNTTLANVLDEAVNAGDKTILVVCYTGQTAARAVGALKLMGYNAKSLKWGMAGWNNEFAASWENNAKDIASPNWVEVGEPIANEEFSYPGFITGLTDGADILEARVRAALQQSGWAATNTEVLANPENFYIVNKWPRASWDAYGHIQGAHLLNTEIEVNGLKNLHPTQTNLIYCYTGQTSAITTMWLNVMGYNARSLKFGVNGIAHSKLVVGTAGDAHKKSWKGEGSGSVNNFGYYDSAGTYYGPTPQ